MKALRLTTDDSEPFTFQYLFTLLRFPGLVVQHLDFYTAKKRFLISVFALLFSKNIETSFKQDTFIKMK